MIPGTPVSSTKKTDRHDITEIFVEIVVKHHKPNLKIIEHSELQKIQQCTEVLTFVRLIDFTEQCKQI